MTCPAVRAQLIRSRSPPGPCHPVSGVPTHRDAAARLLIVASGCVDGTDGHPRLLRRSTVHPHSTNRSPRELIQQKQIPFTRRDTMAAAQSMAVCFRHTMQKDQLPSREDDSRSGDRESGFRRAHSRDMGRPRRAGDRVNLWWIT